MKITIENIPLARGFEHCEHPADLKILTSKEVQVASLLRAREVKSSTAAI